MHAWAGYITPKGFYPVDYIDLGDTEYWFSRATLELISAECYLIDGEPVSTRDMMPGIVMDANIDRMLCAHSGGGGYTDIPTGWFIDL